MAELRYLHYLTVISQKGTLSGAAEALHITQPALTRAMQKLEEEMGLPLFERTKNRAVLNDAGKLAVDCAREVLEAEARMTARMESYRKSLTTVTVGACAPGPTFTLIPRLTALYPGRTVSSELRPEEELPEALRRGAYQLAVLSAPLEEEGILCRPYVRESLMVSLPAAHPLARRPRLRLSDLDGLTMLLSTGLGVWQRLHDQMKNVRFIVQNDRKALHALVAASDLPNFVTNLSRQYIAFVPENRVAVPLEDPEATVQFYLCARRKDRRMLEDVMGE